MRDWSELVSEKKRINVYMPAELHDKLKEVAASYGNSVNGYLVWLIQRDIFNFEQVAKQSEQTRPAEQVRQTEQANHVVTENVLTKPSDVEARIQQRLEVMKHRVGSN